MILPPLTSLSARVVGALVAAAVAVAVIWGAWHFYTGSRTQAAQARVERAQGKAASQSAHDAIRTVVAAGEREAASEQLTRTNETEIRHAKGADVRVDPAVASTGMLALCRREAYRSSERCRVFQPHSPDVAQRSGRR